MNFLDPKFQGISEREREHVVATKLSGRILGNTVLVYTKTLYLPIREHSAPHVVTTLVEVAVRVVVRLKVWLRVLIKVCV